MPLASADAQRTKTRYNDSQKIVEKQIHAPDDELVVGNESPPARDGFSAWVEAGRIHVSLLDEWLREDEQSPMSAFWAGLPFAASNAIAIAEPEDNPF